MAAAISLELTKASSSLPPGQVKLPATGKNGINEVQHLHWFFSGVSTETGIISFSVVRVLKYSIVEMP